MTTEQDEHRMADKLTENTRRQISQHNKLFKAEFMLKPAGGIKIVHRAKGMQIIHEAQEFKIIPNEK